MSVAGGFKTGRPILLKSMGDMQRKLPCIKIFSFENMHLFSKSNKADEVMLGINMTN